MTDLNKSLKNLMMITEISYVFSSAVILSTMTSS